MAAFSRINGREPTWAALIALRKLFCFTGPITRDQRRILRAMEEAFEAHAPEILHQLESESVTRTVTRILAVGDPRRYPARQSEHNPWPDSEQECQPHSQDQT
jgi:hypothetical protein